MPYDPLSLDGTTAAVGVPIAAYGMGLSLLALWLYYLFQPQYTPNPGLAAYKPPPATVLSEMPARLLAQHWQAPPLAEIESQAEEPKTTVVESEPERTVDVKEPKRPNAPTRTRERNNPLRDYAASYRGYGGAYQGYSGNRPF